MKILTTGGGTSVPIDDVRVITNKSKGTTALKISEFFHTLGNEVTLLTSNAPSSWTQVDRLLQYETFDDLQAAMENEITHGNYDVVIHSAAVSDYRPTGTFVPERPCGYEAQGSGLRLNRLETSGKVGSDYPELFLKLEKTPKLIGMVRKDWGFKGIFVGFKLLVDSSDEELVDVMKKNMEKNQLDICVGNDLRWMKERAIIISRSGSGFTTRNTSRIALPLTLKVAINDMRY